MADDLVQNREAAVALRRALGFEGGTVVADHEGRAFASHALGKLRVEQIVAPGDRGKLGFGRQFQARRGEVAKLGEGAQRHRAWVHARVRTALQFALDLGAQRCGQSRGQARQQARTGPKNAGLEANLEAMRLQRRHQLVGQMVRARMAHEPPFHRLSLPSNADACAQSSAVGRNIASTGAPIWRLSEPAIAPSATTFATTSAHAAPSMPSRGSRT